MCFVWIWEQTAIISLYSIDWLVFVIETECVYCAVRTGSLSTIQVGLSVWRGDKFLQNLGVITAVDINNMVLGDTRPYSLAYRLRSFENPLAPVFSEHDLCHTDPGTMLLPKVIIYLSLFTPSPPPDIKIYIEILH
jgi:hypothetical protein